ncbi:Succinate dehydrogenase subunit 4 [Raphanus sativus]|uniref:Succinate dehydrogenase subunit 4, mitochondrial n=1 Tax=Raphanus sativus TaxID=3726 RepID=A0A6J0MLQ8_RAPSA|nr:succinate dehydrogenase subunit 4, mitochondrial [Raphanus sativus]KAJ4906393.1 Succinate dehydrogenase subunit 4 [Raphanus sativus]
MSLRRSILGLHRQTHNLSLSKALPFSMSNISSPCAASAAVRNPIGREISSIPFSLLTQKPNSGNLAAADRSVSSPGKSDLAKFARLPSSRGYSNASLVRKIPVLFHINAGMEEVLADYVHQEMTRNLMVISLGLFQIIVIKDVIVFLFF